MRILFLTIILSMISIFACANSVEMQSEEELNDAQKILLATKEYCIKPLVKKESIAEKLSPSFIELQGPAKEAFTKPRGGRAFGLLPNVAVISSSEDGLCQIMIKQIDAKEFLAELVKDFENNSIYSKTVDENNESEFHKEFTAKIDGVSILVIGRGRMELPTDGALQALISVGKTK